MPYKIKRQIIYDLIDEILLISNRDQTDALIAFLQGVVFRRKEKDKQDAYLPKLDLK